MAGRKLDPYTLGVVSRRLQRDARDWLSLSKRPHTSDEAQLQRRSFANILRETATDLRQEARALETKATKGKRK